MLSTPSEWGGIIPHLYSSHAERLRCEPNRACSVRVCREVCNDKGPLQLTFNDGSVLLLKGASDGERMQPVAAKWSDPFEGPLDEANALYVEQSGKWSLFDVSGEPPFSSLIGETVSGVNPIFDNFGVLAGAQFVIGSEFLDFCVGGDEDYVFWGEHNETLIKWRYKVGEREQT
jgi:hypothetical protein